MKQFAYVLMGLLLGLILSGALFWVTHLEGGTPIPLEPSPTKVAIEVQVVGGVARPGIYTLPDGSRVQDAVTAAGGLLAGTDQNSINLVARLEDGQQLEIPSGLSQGASTPFTSPFSTISTPGANSSKTSLININTANLAILDTLPGIGPTTAQKIIDYRSLHGLFTNIEDLMNVSGIGPATFDRLQKLITTN